MKIFSSKQLRGNRHSSSIAHSVHWYKSKSAVSGYSDTHISVRPETSLFTCFQSPSRHEKRCVCWSSITSDSQSDRSTHLNTVKSNEVKAAQQTLPLKWNSLWNGKTYAQALHGSRSHGLKSCKSTSPPHNMPPTTQPSSPTPSCPGLSPDTLPNPRSPPGVIQDLKRRLHKPVPPAAYSPQHHTWDDTRWQSVAAWPAGRRWHLGSIQASEDRSCRLRRPVEGGGPAVVTYRQFARVALAGCRRWCGPCSLFLGGCCRGRSWGGWGCWGRGRVSSHWKRWWYCGRWRCSRREQEAGWDCKVQDKAFEKTNGILTLQGHGCWAGW